METNLTKDITIVCSDDDPIKDKLLKAFDEKYKDMVIKSWDVSLSMEDIDPYILDYQVIIDERSDYDREQTKKLMSDWRRESKK